MSFWIITIGLIVLGIQYLVVVVSFFYSEYNSRTTFLWSLVPFVWIGLLSVDLFSTILYKWEELGEKELQKKIEEFKNICGEKKFGSCREYVNGGGRELKWLGREEIRIGNFKGCVCLKDLDDNYLNMIKENNWHCLDYNVENGTEQHIWLDCFRYELEYREKYLFDDERNIKLGMI